MSDTTLDYEAARSVSNEARRLETLSRAHYLAASSLSLQIPALSIFAYLSDVSRSSGNLSVQAYFSMMQRLNFGIAMFVFLIYSALAGLAGWFIKTRRWQITSIVINLVLLLAFPFGTLLAPFTLFLLNRKSSVALYRA